MRCPLSSVISAAHKNVSQNSCIHPQRIIVFQLQIMCANISREFGWPIKIDLSTTGEYFTIAPLHSRVFGFVGCAVPPMRPWRCGCGCPAWLVERGLSESKYSYMKVASLPKLLGLRELGKWNLGARKTQNFIM